MAILLRWATLLLDFERSSSPCADKESGEAAGTTNDGGSVLQVDGVRLGAGGVRRGVRPGEKTSAGLMQTK